MFSLIFLIFLPLLFYFFAISDRNHKRHSNVSLSQRFSKILGIKKNKEVDHILSYSSEKQVTRPKYFLSLSKFRTRRSLAKSGSNNQVNLHSWFFSLWFAFQRADKYFFCIMKLLENLVKIRCFSKKCLGAYSTLPKINKFLKNIVVLYHDEKVRISNFLFSRIKFKATMLSASFIIEDF